MKLQTLFILFILVIFSCKEDNKPDIVYDPTPVELKIPEVFKERILAPVIPKDNPLTKEGIALGKKLFYDPILSKNHSLACASCHRQGSGFTNNQRFAKGVEQKEVKRNTMPLVNVAWNYYEKYAWDGHANSIEIVAEHTITDPLEMNNTWENAIEDLENDEEYPTLFTKAFGTDKITKELASKAIAQFIRTISSANSKFDKYLRGEAELTFDERMGYFIFEAEEKGDCFHCHGSIDNPLWTDNRYHNNGMDSVFEDLGLENVTGLKSDRGRFRTPSLRNLKFTAPYMHDGRYATLDEVIDHYSEGLVFSPSIDPLMKSAYKGGVHLTAKEKKQLKAFLLSLSDDELVNNPEYEPGK